MTLVQRRSEATAPPEPARSARRIRIGLIVADIHVGVALDALAPVARQVQAVVDLANVRLGELGRPRLDPTGGKGPGGKPVRGRWALCWVDGTPLRGNRSLTDQGVIEGAQLWLQFVDDTEARKPVIEHVTSAVPAELRKNWRDVTPAFGTRVGLALVAVAVTVVLAVLGWWRHQHEGWLTAAAAGGLAVVLLVSATVIGLRSARHRRAAQAESLDRDRREELDAELLLADVMRMLGVAAAALGAAVAVPGPLGAPQAAVASAVLLAAAVLIIRFTGRQIGVCTAVIVVCSAVLLTAVARMLWVTSAVTLLTVVLLATVLAVKLAPSIARQAAKIRLPVFPSASGRWIFETRPDLPATVVVAAGADPELDGPESVRNVVVATDRVHSVLTGLLGGLSVLLVACSVGLSDPLTDRRWLPLLIAGIMAGWAVLHGRSYTDRWQATLLATAGAAIVVAAAARYALELWTAPSLLIACAVILAVPAAGLVAAIAVPQNFYTPVFKQLVEWVEYLLLLAMFPLGFWLMGVFAAIRYRS